MNVGTLIRDLQAVAIAEKGVDWTTCRSSGGDADLSPGTRLIVKCQVT